MILTEFAPAKVNLTLRILGRRADGYHNIESLVAFARVGDHLSLRPEGALELNVNGATAAFAGNLADNLVLRAATELGKQIANLRLGQFSLTKELPVAAGLGGGSSDAAAALRLIARVNGLPIDDRRILDVAGRTGADVPVCVTARSCVMRGIGDILSEPVSLPELPAVLVNPGVAVPTKGVFEKLGLRPGETRADPDDTDLGSLKDRNELLAYLASHPNDLEPPAIALEPIIAEARTELSKQKDCLIARMSGSGATCFALFETAAAAQAGAKNIKAKHPSWWVVATSLGS